MTKRECAIIMAHTGICMLAGDDFNIFHKYCEDLLGHPIFTHQFPMYEKEIKERSFEDFKELCACSTVEPQRIKGRWLRKESDLSWWYECSECGESPLFDPYEHEVRTPFCPWCGVEMQDEQEQEPNRPE